MGAQGSIKRNLVGDITDIDLTKKHIDILFKITEKQNIWYGTHFPSDKISFDCFLKYNHMKLFSKLTSLKNEEITDKKIEETLKKTFKFYDYMDEIMLVENCCDELL